MYFVYIILCEDQTLYTGSTNNVEKRFQTHLTGKGSKYTRSHRPIKLIYQEKFSTKSEALKRESEIKSWNRNKKISMLKLQNLLVI